VLASAGVRVLYQLTEQLAAHQQALGLRMPARSPARTAVDLARLPYTAAPVP
jgi:hypothetical protein